MSTNQVARDPREVLRKERRALVLAAEDVIDQRFQRGRLNKPNKTQFSNLVSLCNEASCAEEITNYLRYQAGREAWDREFALSVIDAIKPVMARLPDDPGLHVGAWKLYATYLTRAYVYQKAATDGRSS